MKQTLTTDQAANLLVADKDADEDAEEAAAEWLADRTTVIEFSEGVIIQRF